MVIISRYGYLNTPAKIISLNNTNSVQDSTALKSTIQLKT